MTGKCLLLPQRRVEPQRGAEQDNMGKQSKRKIKTLCVSARLLCGPAARTSARLPGEAGSRQGMTIIEVMISLAIITIMIGLIAGTLANYLRMTAAARNTVEIVGKHEKILRKMRGELRQSSSNRLSQKQWWIENDGRQLRLRKLAGFAIDAGGNPQLTWSSDIIYTSDAEGFVTRTQDGSTVRVTDRVIELTFTEIENGRVRIDLTNEAGDPTRNTQSILKTTIEVTPQN